ncbi:MAG: C-GCAxxG-C-C family protein [Candidatus Hodarchaeota archaeon]
MLDQELLEQVYQLAYNYESQYGNCPQCVIAAVSEVFSLSLEELLKSAHGLAGGVGLSGAGTCGALSGGVMVLGHFYGRERKYFGQRFLKSYQKVKELYDKFIEEFGGPTCHEVQKKLFGRSFNLWDKDDFRKFEEAGAHKDKCPQVTGNVAKWVTTMLLGDISITLPKPMKKMSK